MSFLTGILSLVMALIMASGYIVFVFFLLATLLSMPIVAYLAFAELIKEREPESAPTSQALVVNFKRVMTAYEKESIKQDSLEAS